MGVYDHCAWFATRDEVDIVVRRLLAPTDRSLVFRTWMEERTIAFPGGKERTADLTGIIDDPSSPETVIVFEFQSRHDPKKLATTLLEVAVLRVEAEEREQEQRILAALVYLTGRCPLHKLEMKLGDFGTSHTTMVWNIGDEDAMAVLESVSNGGESPGILHWASLMNGADQIAVIDRWKEVTLQKVPDRAKRGNMAVNNGTFSELVGRGQEWKRGLEGFDMTESTFVNEWIDKGELRRQRSLLLRLLNRRFPQQLPQQVNDLIRTQESMDLLESWFDAATDAQSFEEFMNVLKR